SPTTSATCYAPTRPASAPQATAAPCASQSAPPSSPSSPNGSHGLGRRQRQTLNRPCSTRHSPQNVSAACKNDATRRWPYGHRGPPLKFNGTRDILLRPAGPHCRVLGDLTALPPGGLLLGRHRRGRPLRWRSVRVVPSLRWSVVGWGGWFQTWHGALSA